MKSFFIKTVALALTLVIILFSFFGCATAKKEYAQIKNEEQNLISACLNANGESVNSCLTGKNDETVYVDLMFAEPSMVNTVILQEENDYVTLFNIYALNDGQAQLIYSQDKIGGYRVCSFSAVSADGLRLEVVKSKSAFNIKDIKAFYITCANDDFTVSSYVNAQDIYNPDNIDVEALQAIDEFIFYANASFDENGNIELKPSVVDGNEIDGSALLKTAMENLRKAVDKELLFSVVLSAPSDDANIDNIKSIKANGDKCVTAIEGGRLINNIISFLDEYSFNGVVIDWNFPVTAKQWQFYSNLLVALKTADLNKNIGVCFGGGNYKLSQDAYKYIDRVILNAYDISEDDGYHSDFDSATELIAKLHKSGCDYSKIQLGLSFYGKPVDKTNVVFDYKAEAYKLGKFGNLASGEIKGYVNDEETVISQPRYYNGYQMIYDKTSYALYMGLYGAVACDYIGDLPYYDELSLFKAINTSLRDKEKTADENEQAEITDKAENETNN